MPQRGLDRDAGVHADDRVEEAARVHRLGRVPRHLRHARGLLEPHRPADVVAPRALETEARHPQHDHVGLDGADLVVAEPELLDDTRGEVLEHDVDVRDEAFEDLLALGAGEVEGQVTLVEVRRLPHRAALVPVVALLGERAAVAEAVRPLDRLHLDHVRAERAEVHAEVRARPRTCRGRGRAARRTAGRVRPAPPDRNRAVAVHAGAGASFAAGSTGAATRAAAGVPDSRHGGPGNTSSLPGSVVKNGRDPELREPGHRAAVPHRGGRDAERLADPDDLLDGVFVEPRPGTREEAVELLATPGQLGLAVRELLDVEHGADVLPVLTGERVDPDPSVLAGHDARDRRVTGLGTREAEPVEGLLQQHRVRERARRALEHRQVGDDRVPAGARRARCGERRARRERSHRVLVQAPARSAPGACAGCRASTPSRPWPARRGCCSAARPTVRAGRTRRSAPDRPGCGRRARRGRSRSARARRRPGARSRRRPRPSGRAPWPRPRAS